MSGINDEKDRLIIEELSVTNRLLTDLTKAGSWVVNYAPDGSVASVQWGDGFRRLMGYSDRSDFPDEIESFVRGIHPEDREVFIGDTTVNAFNEDIMCKKGYEFRFRRKDGSTRWFRSKGILYRDAEGKSVKFRGVTIEISREKELDKLYAQLQNESASLNTIHDSGGCLMSSGRLSKRRIRNLSRRQRISKAAEYC